MMLTRIHGPHRSELILEHHDPGIREVIVHLLRVLAERLFPELIAKDERHLVLAWLPTRHLTEIPPWSGCQVRR